MGSGPETYKNLSANDQDDAERYRALAFHALRAGDTALAERLETYAASLPQLESDSELRAFVQQTVHDARRAFLDLRTMDSGHRSVSVALPDGPISSAALNAVRHALFTSDEIKAARTEQVPEDEGYRGAVRYVVASPEGIRYTETYDPSAGIIEIDLDK